MRTWNVCYRAFVLKAINDALPLDPGLLEIDEKTNGPAGSSQIIETLRGMFVGKTLYALQLDNQYVFDQNIRKIFSD